MFYYSQEKNSSKNPLPILQQKKKHDTHGHPYTRSYTHMMMLLRTIMLKKIVRFLRKTKNLCESWQTKKKTKTDLHKNVSLFSFQAYRSRTNSNSLFLS